MEKISQFFLALLTTIHSDGVVMRAEARSDPQTVGPAKGWLIIQGGGKVTNEVKERFVALAGGADKSAMFCRRGSVRQGPSASAGPKAACGCHR